MLYFWCSRCVLVFRIRSRTPILKQIITSLFWVFTTVATFTWIPKWSDNFTRTTSAHMSDNCTCPTSFRVPTSINIKSWSPISWRISENCWSGTYWLDTNTFAWRTWFHASVWNFVRYSPTRATSRPVGWRGCNRLIERFCLALWIPRNLQKAPLIIWNCLPS